MKKCREEIHECLECCYTDRLKDLLWNDIKKEKGVRPSSHKCRAVPGKFGKMLRFILQLGKNVNFEKHEEVKDE